MCYTNNGPFDLFPSFGWSNCRRCCGCNGRLAHSQWTTTVDRPIDDVMNQMQEFLRRKAEAKEGGKGEEPVTLVIPKEDAEAVESFLEDLRATREYHRKDRG